MSSARSIEGFVLNEICSGAPGSASDPFNFIDATSAFITKWLNAFAQSIPPGENAYACFIGIERVSKFASQNPSTYDERHAFADDTPSDLLGSAYISSYALNRVYSTSQDFKNLDQCQTFVKMLDVDDAPVIILNAAAKKIHVKEANNKDYRTYEIKPKMAEGITKDNFDDLLNEFHSEFTQQPQGISLPWSKPKDGLLSEQIEEHIRNDLFLHLRYASGRQGTVIREAYNSAGRTDLLVYIPEEEFFFFTELKVIREWRKSKDKRLHVPPKEQLEWTKSGVKQAHLYKQEKNRDGIPYACCFDARDKDAELDEAVELAKELNVEYRRYFMHRSSKEHRAAIKT